MGVLAEEEMTRRSGSGSTEAGGAAVRLTDRDRDLLGLLVLARYMTAGQVHRLAFPGKNLSVAYRRLVKLTGTGRQPAFLRQTFFRTYDGKRVAVWAPTQYAMPAALARAGTLPELPKHDVGAHFLEHLVQLNELLIELWADGHRCPKVNHPSYRWTPSDRIRLTWGEYEVHRGRQQQRFIQPDAVLELPAQRLRFFLECEMGTQPINVGNGNAQGATVTKAERYHRYLTRTAGLRQGQTHYTAQFPDGFQAKVLFLVLTPARSASVNAALVAWRSEKGLQAGGTLRALTFREATAELRGLAGLGVPASSGPNPAPSSEAVGRTPSAEDIRRLRRFAQEALKAIQGARHAVRRLPGDVREQHRLTEPPYPADAAEVQQLLGRLSQPGAP
jgi:hypothetical protein